MPDARRLAALADALLRAKSPAERLDVTAAALRASGVSPVADREVPGESGRFAVGPTGETLAGWIPGRIPVHLDSLVVAVAPRDGASDLALLEAARMLVARGAYTQTPARSVLIVLGNDVPSAVRLWRRDAVVSSVVVGAVSAPSLAGRPVRTVASGPPAETAAAAHEALLAAVTPPSPYRRP